MQRCECFSPPPSEMMTEVVETSPIEGQKPGTSGLRKPTKEFMGTNYTENFVSATLIAMGPDLNRSTLVVGGDGRYYCMEAALKIIQMCAAYKVGSCKSNASRNVPALDKGLRYGTHIPRKISTSLTWSSAERPGTLATGTTT